MRVGSEAQCPDDLQSCLTATDVELVDRSEVGWAQSGTVKTGLDHLVELGVTHVQLLPIQDFENNERADAYNWGYVTTFFNTPEGWYATTPAQAAAGTEPSAAASLRDDFKLEDDEEDTG